MKIKTMLILLAATMLTAGCQPTPEAPPIVGKADNHLEEMIASSKPASASPSQSVSPQTTADQAALSAALRETLGAPEKLTDSYTNKKGDVTVYIDAKIDVPAVSDIPAVEVTFSKFTQDEVDMFAAYFLNGAPVYTEERVRTKEDVMERIVNEQRQLERMKDMDDSKDKTMKQMIKQAEERISGLIEEYEAAPEKRERTPATLELKETDYGAGLSVVADLGKEEVAGFRVGNADTGSDIGFTNEGKGYYDYIGLRTEELDGLPRGMSTTLEEAQSIVRQCLSDLGIDYIQIENVKAGTYFRDINDHNDKEYLASAKQCYVFNMERTVRGVPVPSIEASTANEGDDPSMPTPKEPEFNNIPPPERFIICVDDTGIVRFEWLYPVREESVLSGHVSLMNFDEVLEKAKDYMFYKTYSSSVNTSEIYITGIRLSMMRIMLRDKPGQYMLAPVWDFIGNRKDYMYDEQVGEWLPFGDQSYVTINAIDGSNIDRDWGY